MKTMPFPINGESLKYPAYCVDSLKIMKTAFQLI